MNELERRVLSLEATVNAFAGYLTALTAAQQAIIATHSDRARLSESLEYMRSHLADVIAETGFSNNVAPEMAASQRRVGEQILDLLLQVSRPAE